MESPYTQEPQLKRSNFLLDSSSVCSPFILNTLRAYNFSFFVVVFKIYFSHLVFFLIPWRGPGILALFILSVQEACRASFLSTVWTAKWEEAKTELPNDPGHQAQQTPLEKEVIKLFIEKCFKEEKSLHMNGSHLYISLTCLCHSFDGTSRGMENSLAKS